MRSAARDRLQPADDLVQVAAREILHVQQAQALFGQQPLIVNAHDLRMIELGQCLGLPTLDRGWRHGRDLQSDQPLHGALACQENPGKRSLAQRRQQVEIIQLLPRLDPHKLLPRPAQAQRLLGLLQVQQSGQLGSLLGEPRQEFLGTDGVA